MGNDKELKEKYLEKVSGGVGENIVADHVRFMKTGICPKCKQKILGCANNLQKCKEHLLNCLG